MSVVRSKRGESDMEFIMTARELQLFSIRKCTHFPKRYTFYVSQPIAKSATKVHECVKKANSIYPTNEHEAQMRRDYLIMANVELNSLVSQIEIAHELFGLELKIMSDWSALIDKEIRLVKGAIKKDKERYRF